MIHLGEGDNIFHFSLPGNTPKSNRETDSSKFPSKFFAVYVCIVFAAFSHVPRGRTEDMEVRTTRAPFSRSFEALFMHHL